MKSSNSSNRILVLEDDGELTGYVVYHDDFGVLDLTNIVNCASTEWLPSTVTIVGDARLLSSPYASKQPDETKTGAAPLG